MRRLRFLLAGVLVAAPLTVIAAIPAGAAVPGGTYVALAHPVRVLDSRIGAAGNRKGAVPAGQGISPTIAGRAGLPASGMASIVGTLSADSPTGTGGIVAYTGTRPSTTNIQFVSGHSMTNTVILPLSGGRVSLHNSAASGSVQMVLDVSGYYTTGSASTSDPGIYHGVHASRVVDSRTGADGNRKGALGPHVAIVPVIGGHGGVPSSAGAVAVTITVVSPTKSGTIIGYRPGEPRQQLPLLHYAAGHSASAFAVLRLSSARTELVNESAGSVQLVVDVSGYYNTGFAQTANAFQTVVQTGIGGGTVAANGDLDVRPAGKGGVPRTGVTAVLATVHVSGAGKAGSLQAWAAGGARPGVTDLQWGAGQTTSNVLFVPVSSDGSFALHNASAGSVTISVDIDGYVPGTAAPVPAAKAVAHYASDLAGPNPSGALGAEGTADAENHATFVLLDIGAQANDGKGVVPSGTSKEINYEVLRADLGAYVQAFANAGGTGTIAFGTNNDGTDWTKYPAAKRGADWWNLVVSQIATRAGVTLVGADDIEPGFFSTVGEALAWETAYLDADTTGHSQLYFNGSADGCPMTWTAGATCAFKWTEQNLYDLATGNKHASRTHALPQVYFGYMATQWAEIDRTGGGGIDFAGSLSTHATDSGSLTPPQSWTALYRAVSSVSGTPIGSVVADIS